MWSTLLADMDAMVHNRIAAFRDGLNTVSTWISVMLVTGRNFAHRFHGEEIMSSRRELDAATLSLTSIVRDVPPKVNRVLFGGTVNAIFALARPVITLPEHQPLHQFQRIGYTTRFQPGRWCLITRLLDFAGLYDARMLLPVHDSIWMWNMTSPVNWKRSAAQRSRKADHFYLQENLRILDGLELFHSGAQSGYASHDATRHYLAGVPPTAAIPVPMALHARIPILIFHGIKVCTFLVYKRIEGTYLCG